MIENKLRPIHPGEILREEYLLPMALSANALSLALRVPATRIGKILKRAERYYTRYGTSSCQILWYRCSELDESTNQL